MEKRSEFVIQFASLPPGVHQYDFEINDSFFKGYEHPLLDKASVEVHVKVLKAPHNMQLTFHFKGTIKVECGRCLEEFDLPVDAEIHLPVRQVTDDEVEDNVEDDVLNISGSDQTIDLAPHFYDYLSLQLPLNPVHADDKNGVPSCNPEVIKLLKKIEAKPSAIPKDPRWDALRNIKLN